jgi:hypothetical protein
MYTQKKNRVLYFLKGGIFMKKWLTLIFAAMLLSACSGQQGANDHQVGAVDLDFHDKSINKKGTGHVHTNSKGAHVIPSIDRAKKKTTDTVQGLGTNVYSTIGSSGLHDGGISSHLESRLSAAGIPGIKVFVLDDTVILARGKAEVTSTSYDSMQNKVLSNTSGISGKGALSGVNPKPDTDDNLDKAKALMNKSFNGQVQILTVTNPTALTLIDRIKTNLKNNSPNYRTLSSDINTLVQMTREK